MHLRGGQYLRFGFPDKDPETAPPTAEMIAGPLRLGAGAGMGGGVRLQAWVQIQVPLLVPVLHVLQVLIGVPVLHVLQVPLLVQ